MNYSPQEIIETNGAGRLVPHPRRHPARFAWQEVTKVIHYRLEVNAMTRPMRLREELKPYGKDAP